MQSIVLIFGRPRRAINCSSACDVCSKVVRPGVHPDVSFQGVAVSARGGSAEQKGRPIVLGWVAISASVQAADGRL